MYKVCPDYMSSGLLEYTGLTRNNGTEAWYFVGEDVLDNILSYETRQLLAMCQQIFDQVDSWSNYPKPEDVYKFPKFIRKEQYEILCKLVAERIEKETSVLTFAEFYWETDK